MDSNDPLRGRERRSKGQIDDRRAQTDALGHDSEKRQRGEWVERALAWGVGRCIRSRMRRQSQTFIDPYGIQPGFIHGPSTFT